MILRSEKPELIKMLTNKLRRYMPKAFFSITKASIKDVRKGQVAIGFASEIIDERIESKGTIP